MSVPGTGCTEEKRCNVFTRTRTRTRKERQSRCTFFFFGVHFFVDISIPSVRPPVRHREAMLKASPLRPCANRDPHSPHMPPPNVILMLTHGLQAGVTMCCPPPPSTRSVPLELFHFPWQISPWAIHQRHKPILKAQDDFVTTAATLLCHAASFSFTNKPKYSLHIPALSACNFCIAGTTCSSQPSSSKTLGHLICVCEAMTSITCCPVCCTTLH